MRVGIGYDSHRFSEDPARRLILGGVEIEDAPGLSGHSDGDAVLHAVIDAMLGAAAAGDIGTHFPPGDEQWKDADSVVLLRRAHRIVEDRGLRPSNVDVTVICESPRISPRARTIRERLGAVVGLPVERVSIKGKSNEGMGFIGRGEGLAVLAVVGLEET